MILIFSWKKISGSQNPGTTVECVTSVPNLWFEFLATLCFFWLLLLLLFPTYFHPRVVVWFLGMKKWFRLKAVLQERFGNMQVNILSYPMTGSMGLVYLPILMPKKCMKWVCGKISPSKSGFPKIGQFFQTLMQWSRRIFDNADLLKKLGYGTPTREILLTRKSCNSKKKVWKWRHNLWVDENMVKYPRLVKIFAKFRQVMQAQKGHVSPQKCQEDTLECNEEPKIYRSRRFLRCRISFEYALAPTAAGPLPGSPLMRLKQTRARSQVKGWKLTVDVFSNPPNEIENSEMTRPY